MTDAETIYNNYRSYHSNDASDAAHMPVLNESKSL